MHIYVHTHRLLLWIHSFMVNLSNSAAFSLGSILVASGPSVYQLPMLHVADERTQHSQEYRHEERFHVGSPEEAMSPNTTSETQAGLSYPLEVWWNLCDNIIFHTHHLKKGRIIDAQVFIRFSWVSSWRDSTCNCTAPYARNYCQHQYAML